ncbi:MAG: ATP-dependent Clp protease ATP-binding subunit ClpA, partial [Polyangiales bacterium]
VVLLLTTNAGATEATAKVIGFDDDAAHHQQSLASGRAKAAIERTFAPEFRNRLDAWVPFAGLSPEVMHAIVDKELAALGEQLAAQKLTLDVTKPARIWLAERGYDPAFGARPLARLVQEQIRKPAAKALLADKITAGQRITVEVHPEGEALTLRCHTATSDPASTTP